RSRTRDAVRMSDVRQIQAGLELFFIDHNAYPESVEATALGTPTTGCLSEQGFSSNCADGLYLEAVPSTPTSGLNQLSSCSDRSNAYCYFAENGNYRISFELEHDNPLIGLVKGLNCATESGLESGACSSLLISASQ
ncbi:MAG: hypothetical protein UU36_C0024G0001, partial [Candidatus Uhrbacteria bacterium GW2011_GWE2_41_1153]